MEGSAIRIGGVVSHPCFQPLEYRLHHHTCPLLALPYAIIYLQPEWAQLLLWRTSTIPTLACSAQNSALLAKGPNNGAPRAPTAEGMPFASTAYLRVRAVWFIGREVCLTLSVSLSPCNMKN